MGISEKNIDAAYPLWRERAEVNYYYYATVRRGRRQKGRAKTSNLLRRKKGHPRAADL